MVIMECEYETAPKLSNGTILNDPELPITVISRSRNYFTPNISETIRYGYRNVKKVSECVY